ncbi:MAG: PQQ-binding-like beta-propeller repeat protein [Bacillota bacterium]
MDSVVNRALRKVPPSVGVARILSVVVGALVLWAVYAEHSYVEERQILDALRTVGVLAWPAVLAPWLGERFTLGVRFVLGLLGIVAGYWFTGQPLLIFTYYTTLSNVKLLPYLGGAAIVLLVLLAMAPQPKAFSTRTPRVASRIAVWLPCVVLSASLGWTLSILTPVMGFARVKPGEVALSTLMVVETYLMEAPDNTDLVGYATDEVIVVCSANEALIRLPDGTAKVVDLSLNLEALEIVEVGSQVFILDKEAGELHCFDSGTGDRLWTAVDLGTVHQVRWSLDGWFLNYPEESDFDPAVGEVSLTKVDLLSGTSMTWALTPPDNWFWPEATESHLGDWFGAELGLSGDQAFVRMGLRSDAHSEVSKYSMFLALPSEDLGRSWSLVQLPGSRSSTELMGVAKAMAVYLSYRDDGLWLVARDIASGIEVWNIHIGAGSHRAKPLKVLPDRILLDWDSLDTPIETGLACLDPVTGREMWRYRESERWIRSMVSVGANTVILAQDYVFSEDPRDTLIFLDADGKPVWSYEFKNLAHIVEIDAEKDRIRLLEGVDSQLSTWSGMWGTETVLSLSNGQPITLPDEGPRGKSGDGFGREDLGNYRYLVIDNALYRTREKITGDYARYRPVMRLEGRGVGIRDLVRGTDSVLARPDMVVVACRVASGVKVSLLKPVSPK